MSTLADRNDMQSGLLAPGTPKPGEYAALLHLQAEVERHVRNTGDAVLHGAVVSVKETQR